MAEIPPIEEPKPPLRLRHSKITPPIPNPDSRLKLPSTRIENVPPIQETDSIMRQRTDIPNFVEPPLVPACEELYDKNVQTISSSANRKNLEGEQDGWG